MAARSATHQVTHPYPVVFDALVAALPAHKFRLEQADVASGRVVARTLTERVTIHLGAIDAVTTAWVADAELRLGIGPDRHAATFARVASALDDYLSTYYGAHPAG